MIAVGCDVGSLTAEAVILDGDKILGSEIIRVRPKSEQSALEVMGNLLARCGLSYDDIDFCVSTGYGREKIPFADDNVSEISAHGRGAQWLNPEIRTIIDVGGQDCKVIRVDPNGRLIDFVMNDKCAAGTGRSLEIMADTLGIPIERLGPLSLDAKEAVLLTNMCSIFCETEIFHLLCEDRDIADIAAGINESMARRVKMLTGRVGIEPKIGMTGGVSKNIGVVKALERLTDTNFVAFTEDPQIIGALGAAVIAKEKFERGIKTDVLLRL
jgi:predicted CoA-substrate-specific enzyme activase